MTTDTTAPEITQEKATQEQAPGRHWLDLANETRDPLECLAMALTGLLEVAVVAGENEAQADDQSALINQLDAEVGERDGTIAAVRAIVDKSTAGWADKIRTALGDTPAEVSTSSQQTPPSGPPARDADIEEWRAYAVAHGLPAEGLDQLNRSQIRTALGISNGDGA